MGLRIVLVEIFIQNFVLIDDLRLELGPGLNVLTGETGAGKSIIIDALGLIMGDRMKSEYIRDSSRKTVIEAVFDIHGYEEMCLFLIEKGLLGAEETTLIISREVLPSGRSSARINGRNLPISSLKILMTNLVDLHVQHDQLQVLKPERYLQYVDSFNVQTEERLGKVKDLYNRWRSAQQKLDQLQSSQNHQAQRIDFLSYQIKELEEAGLKAGEEEELQELRGRISNAAQLLAGGQKLLSLLYRSDHVNSAYDQIAMALDTVRSLQSESFFQGLVKPLEEMYYRLEDMAAQISPYLDGLDFDPGLLDEVEGRLHEIERLKSKYGNNVEEILAYLNEARSELEELQAGGLQKEQLEQEVDQLSKIYHKEANYLTEARKEGAQLLEQMVHKELQELHMPHIQFMVSIDTRSKPGPAGLDQIDFLFSPNPGEEMQPLARVASGGEISRFVLALKKALAQVYHVPTLIFDEIDVGVGGSALAAMAIKLKEFSVSHQIILVTHAPQVASYADHHYLIEKSIKNGQTFTGVRLLAGEEHIREIARMLGGELFSEITLQHAREMVLQADE